MAETVHTTRRFLDVLGVRDLPPALCAFDPGYDLGTLTGHLKQSAHLMSMLKISMACWIVAEESVSRAKVLAAHQHGVPTVSGGGPFEIAAAHGRLPEFLDLCADVGFVRVEAGEGFAGVPLDARHVVALTRTRGLEVQYELGSKHDGPFTSEVAERHVRKGQEWLEAGAVELIIEARESASDVGLFGSDGRFRSDLADRFAEAFGLARVVFETPDKRSQFALLDHFGPEVRLANVRLEEVLRVEIYRRGLHSDAFTVPTLAPPRPVEGLKMRPAARTQS